MISKTILAGLAAITFLAGAIAAANFATADPQNAQNSNGVVGLISSMVFELEEKVIQLEEKTNQALEPINPPPAEIPFTPIEKFTLDIKTLGADPASNWYSVSGGSQILHSTDKTTGSDQFTQTDPGDIEFEEVTVVGPFVSGGIRAELLDWLNGWVTGQGERLDATLELLDAKENTVRTVNYFDAIPCEYIPPSVRAGDDSLLEEEFSFKPERIEMALGGAKNNEKSTLAAATSPDEILTSKAFRFEINGQEIPGIATVKPGEFRCELKDATMGNRESNFKDFTVTKPSFGNWRIEKYYAQGDEFLNDLFEQFASGEKKTDPSETITLVYKDREGNDARTVDCFGFTPLHYESVNVDSRNSGQAATEVMEFSVLRCEYA